MKMNLQQKEKEGKIKKFFKKSFEKAFIGIAALTISCGGVETDNDNDNYANDNDNNNNIVDNSDYKEEKYISPTGWNVRFEDSYDSSFTNKFTENQLKFVEWLNEQCKMKVTSYDGNLYFGDSRKKIIYSPNLKIIQYELDGETKYYQSYNQFRMNDTGMYNSRHSIESFNNDTSNRLGLRFTSLVPSSSGGNSLYFGRRTGTHYPKGFGWDVYIMRNPGGNISSVDFQDSSFTYTKDVTYIHVCKTAHDKKDINNFFSELLFIPSAEIQNAINKFNLTKQDIQQMENLTP